MNTKHLEYFQVENFKRFNTLEVKNIGQFNLIVGDNNVGKTTLIEALLFDDENYNQFLKYFFTSIESIRRNSNKLLQISKNIDYFNFFLNQKDKRISYKYQYANSPTTDEFFLTKKVKSELTNAEAENIGAYAILNPNSQYLIEFSFNNNKVLKFLDDFKETSPYFPFISFNTVYANDLVSFFSKISLSSIKYEELKNELRSFIPGLTSIEINNAVIPDDPVLIIREQNSDSIRLLGQYGDGFIKIFRYLLEIDVCENKRLMIDEIDTGVHYSRIKDFIKKILYSAKNKNVQLFMTTHSHECIENYIQALKELGYEDEGRIIKLAETKNGIKAYTSRFNEFENSFLADSEIR